MYLNIKIKEDFRTLKANQEYNFDFSENDKLQDELTTELGPDVVGKITGRRFKSRFKRLVSPIIVPREMYD